MLFGPFWPPYTGQIHAQSVASTLFGQSLMASSPKYAEFGVGDPLLAWGADLGAFLRPVLLRDALGNPHERHPKRRPQTRQHERERPDRRRQQRYLHHHQGRDQPAFSGHGGGGDLQHVEADGRSYGGEAPAVRRISEMKCGPSTPRSIRSPRATAAKRSARIPAEASIRDIVSQPPASFRACRCLRVPKSLPRMPKASMPTSAARPSASPNQGRSRSAGCTYFMMG